MTPADAPVLDAIAELLSPLLGALERIGWVQRHLYPPLAAKLAETLAPHADALAAPLAALEGLAWPGRSRLHARPARRRRAGDRRAGPRFRRRRRDRPRIRHRPLPGAAPRSARVQEALYPLAPVLEPVSRWFLEPARRDDDALSRGCATAALRDDGEQARRPARGQRARRPGAASRSTCRRRGTADARCRSSWRSTAARPRARLPVELARATRARARCSCCRPTARDRTWSIMGGEDVDAEALRAAWSSRWRARYPVDRARVLLTGMSDGAHLQRCCAASATAMPFTHLAPACGVLHPLLFWPRGLERARGRPIYLVHGALDWMFPVHTARMAQTGAGRGRRASRLPRDRGPVPHLSARREPEDARLAHERVRVADRRRRHRWLSAPTACR